jgi:hypothetical protein
MPKTFRLGVIDERYIGLQIINAKIAIRPVNRARTRFENS